jgi:hypothetical protein
VYKNAHLRALFERWTPGLRERPSIVRGDEPPTASDADPFAWLIVQAHNAMDMRAPMMRRRYIELRTAYHARRWR